MLTRRFAFLALLTLVMTCLPVAKALAGYSESLQVAKLASSSNGHFSCAVTTVGGVECWGRNYSGQLGDGTVFSRGLPENVWGLTSGIVLVATGRRHACAVTTEGQVKCWGSNVSGQLGNGTTTDSHTPVDVPGLTDAVAITASVWHTCALTSTGSVFCWGQNSFGMPEYGSSLVPVQVVGLSDAVSIVSGSYHTCALTASGTMKCWGRWSHQTVTPVPGLADVITIAAGASSTCAVIAAGTVKCWNYFPILEPEVVPGVTNAVSVAVGWHHVCAATVSGAARCWGQNWNGELGDGTTTDHYSPVAVLGLANATAIAAGSDYSCAIIESGGVKCWGNNAYGQRGNGHLPQSVLPVTPQALGSGVASVAVGDYHTCSLPVFGPAKCWGGNMSGQLGDGSTTSRSTPVPLSGIAAVRFATIAPGYAHTCGVTIMGGVKCWGDNRYGQLGDGTAVDSSTAVDVLLAPTDYVQAIAIGDWHTCVLLLMGDVKCWGWNVSGQLGTGEWGKGVIRSTPVFVPGFDDDVVIALAAGWRHTCALTAAGKVKCWGANWSGELGDGSKTDRHTPITVAGITNAVAIAAGSASTCALSADATVRCWGAGGATGLDADAVTPVMVPGLDDVVSVDVGFGHRCALISNGEVQCWGHNLNGQLGDGSMMPSAMPVTVQGLDGAVEMISTRAWHTCAVNLAGEAKCWGTNHNGQLGIGGPLDSLTPVYVVGFGDWSVIFQDGFERTVTD